MSRNEKPDNFEQTKPEVEKRPTVFKCVDCIRVSVFPSEICGGRCDCRFYDRRVCRYCGGRLRPLM